MGTPPQGSLCWYKAVIKGMDDKRKTGCVSKAGIFIWLAIYCGGRPDESEDCLHNK